MKAIGYSRAEYCGSRWVLDLAVIVGWLWIGLPAFAATTTDSDPLPFRLLSVALPEAPRITEHPQSQTVPPGTNVVLAVQATGTAPLIYQWRLNGVVIPGETNSVLVLTNIQATQGGSYQAIVANEAGVANSELAAINVISRPLTLSDNLADRMTLVGPSWTGSGSNLGAGSEPGETNHAGAPSGSSVWLAWVAPSNGVTTLSTRGSTFDTVLAVYVGTNVTELTPVVSDEDSGGFYTSTVRFNAVRGTEYQFAIAGFAGAFGDVLLTLSMLPEMVIPHIVVQPASQSVPLGSEAVFTVVATNPPPETALTYQWRFNGQDIPDATNDTLRIENAQAAAVGHYQVLVSNAAGLVAQSQDAVLEAGPVAQVLSVDKVAEVTPPVAANRIAKASLQPAAFTPGFFSVSAGTIGAQLFDNLGAGKHPAEPDHCGVLGGASKFLDFTANESGVVLLDTSGSEIDTVLAVYHRVTLSQMSANLVVCDNNGSADGVRSRVRFSCETGRSYRAFVDGVGGAQGRLSLNWKHGFPPAFQQTEPRRLVIPPSGELRLEADLVGGFPPTSYRWFQDGSEIREATNAVLQLAAVESLHAGRYSVVVANEFGDATNIVAEVTVEAPPPPPYLGFAAGATGILRIDFPRAGDQSWILQGSPDLITWSPLFTNNPSRGPSFVELAIGGTEKQFFRAEAVSSPVDAARSIGVQIFKR